MNHAKVSQFTQSLIHSQREKQIIFKCIKNFLGKNDIEDLFDKEENKGDPEINSNSENYGSSEGEESETTSLDSSSQGKPNIP